MMAQPFKPGIQMDMKALITHYQTYWLEEAAKICDSLTIPGSRECAELIRMRIDQQAVLVLVLAIADSERMKWLHDNSCDLRCVDVPTGGDDYDINWIVIQHYQAKPQEREIGRGFNDNWRQAVDMARGKV